MRKHLISTFFGAMFGAGAMFGGLAVYGASDPTGCMWDQECRAEELSAQAAEENPMPVWLASGQPEMSI